MDFPEKIVIALVALVFSYFAGVYTEHEKFEAYKNIQAGIAEKQAADTKAADLKNKGDADDAQQSYIQAITGVNDWYRDHPVVRVQYAAASGCIVSQTADNPKGLDATAAIGYVSPYSPADTEAVAVRLYDLQQRLIAAGVTYE